MFPVLSTRAGNNRPAEARITPTPPGIGNAFRTRDGPLALTVAEFDRLVDDHAPALYRMAYRMMGDAHEAEDVVQEAFRSAWKSRENYESGRGDRAWLASILRRRVVDQWRRRPPVRVVTEEAPLEIGTHDHDPISDSYSDATQKALDRLPQELRETLLLVVVGELTHQEVANLLNIPLGTVLSRVSRARSRLREFLADPVKS